MFNQKFNGAMSAAVIVSLLTLNGCGADTSSAATTEAKRKVAVTVPTTTVTAAVAPTVTTATSVLSIGLTGVAAIADNFLTSAGIMPTDYANAVTGAPTGGLPADSPDTNGSFRMLCLAGQLLKDDPLVMPGQPGASHLHQFWGNTGTQANSDYNSLRTTGGTTCGDSAAPVNRTAYWMPAMLDGAGNAVKPDLIQTYYKQLPASDPNCKILATACVALPNGLRFTYGYNMKTMTGGPSDPNATEYWMTRFECWTDDAGNTQAVAGTFHNIDDVVKAGCPAGVKLIINFVAPACWDGQNVDVADHRSHVVYATRSTAAGAGCPLDHPYLIPNWSGHVHYTTDANFVAGKWRLSSDDMASQMSGKTVPAGSTLHFDYWEAWSPTVKATWDQYCINGRKTCSDGDLGNGTKITHNPSPRLFHQLVSL